jgi:hypothetical protein
MRKTAIEIRLAGQKEARWSYNTYCEQDLVLY